MDKITITEDFLNTIKKLNKAELLGYASLTENSFKCSDNQIIINIPINLIENVDELKVKCFEDSNLERAYDSLHDKFSCDYDKKNVNFEDILDLQIERNVRFGIREKRRKLYQHECDSSDKSCSIAQKL